MCIGVAGKLHFGDLRLYLRGQILQIRQLPLGLPG
jgi:hypothetical protein